MDGAVIDTYTMDQALVNGIPCLLFMLGVYVECSCRVFMFDINTLYIKSVPFPAKITFGPKLFIFAFYYSY